MDGRLFTIRESVNEIGIAFVSVNAILTNDLGMRRVVTKFSSKTFDTWAARKSFGGRGDMLECNNQDQNFMKLIITGDETWVYGYDPETKAQSSQ